MSDQLEKNWKAYDAVKDQYEAEHLGKVVLLHDGDIIAIYNDSGDAYSIGCEKYGLGNFSMETVGGETYISWSIYDVLNRLDREIRNMPTFDGTVKENQIVFVASISVSGSVPSEQEPKPFKALLDTGAQRTMISEKAVNETGLVSVGHMPITPVSGDSIRIKKYRVRIDIPILRDVKLPDGKIVKKSMLRGKDIEVGLLPFQPHNFDILLGMDYLFGIHLTLFQDLFILSN